jgi:hypothetical protein
VFFGNGTVSSFLEVCHEGTKTLRKNETVPHPLLSKIVKNTADFVNNSGFSLAASA